MVNDEFNEYEGKVNIVVNEVGDDDIILLLVSGYDVELFSFNFVLVIFCFGCWVFFVYVWKFKLVDWVNRKLKEELI